MGVFSADVTAQEKNIYSWLRNNRCRRRCAARISGLYWSPGLSMLLLVCLNVPTSSATASTSSDTFMQFQCSDTGYSIADTSGTAGPGRSRFAQSPAAIAILKTKLKEQKQAKQNQYTTSSIFLKECGCQHDWMSAFCLRADKYKAMDASHAPTVCICRRKDEDEKTCSQFLARCFPTASRPKFPMSNSRPFEVHTASCSCCFNQPDNYCTQLDCKSMQPDFGHTNHTSCLCYTQLHYPSHICVSSSNQISIKQWSGGVTPLDGVMAVTFRPVGASSTTRSMVEESWLTHRMTFLIGAALFALFFAICGGILFTKCNKERRKKNTTLQQQGQQEESNELNHLNEDGCTEANHFLETQADTVEA